MLSGSPDVAQVRLDNAMLLFDEFVHAAAKHPDAATLRGLEGRFALRLQIQPSYWSQIKGRSRQIGERLARQFEQLCHKPAGWMDRPHASAATAPAVAVSPAPRGAGDDALRAVPQDDDERFIVGLVLSYYRRHPQRARNRLLDLLGEAAGSAGARSAARPAAVPSAALPSCGRSIQPTGLRHSCSNWRASRSPICRERPLIWLQ